MRQKRRVGCTVGKHYAIKIVAAFQVRCGAECLTFFQPGLETMQE
jgi:hypothetical protein